MNKLCKPPHCTRTTVILISVILATSLLTCTNIKPINAEQGRSIDLYMQKTFLQPQELVVLSALVTYNNDPVVGKDVAFQIEGPKNAYNNITVWGSSRSNATGIATFSFRIPWPDTNPEEITFGTWFAYATVDIAEQIVMDTLTFQAGWRIKITNVETLNSEWVPKTRYLRQETIVFKSTVENSAETEKTATIVIDVQDANSHPIIHIELENLVLQPGKNYVHGSAQIPKTAALGQAKVSAAAYTAPPKDGGILYSQAFSTTFEIITRDVAITFVVPSKTIVERGETIQIKVDAKNKGHEVESFHVTAYYNQTVIAKKHVAALTPSTTRQLIFEWNTANVPLGNYVISAVADPVEGEIDLDDNTFIDGVVTIRAPMPIEIHDVAIIDVHASPLTAYVGDIVEITVEAANLGDYTESFNVTVYHNNTEITRKVLSLTPSQAITFTTAWNTSGVIEGTYVIWAYAEPVPGEENLANNLFIGDKVTLALRPLPPIRDIAVVGLTANPVTVIAGQNVTVKAVVANLGGSQESFNLTLFYDAILIQTLPLTLPAHTNSTIAYRWNTTNLQPGIYRLWANVTVLEGEITTENNKFEDTTITVKASFPIYDLLTLLILPLAAASLVLLMLIIFYGYLKRRKRRKKRPKHSYAIIVHPRT